MATNAFFTPRGLHVRLPVAFAFGLMAQLRPKVRPSAVLVTTEAIEFTPTAVGTLLSLIGFILHLSPIAIAVLCCLGRVVPYLLSLAGLARHSGWSLLGRWYRPISGYGGASLAVTAILGVLIAGPLAAIGFLVGTLVGGILNMFINLVLLRRRQPILNQPLSGTERFFLDALRLHAADSGQPLDLERPASGEAWREALDDYAAEYPDRARQSLPDQGPA